MTEHCVTFLPNADSGPFRGLKNETTIGAATVSLRVIPISIQFTAGYSRFGSASLRITASLLKVLCGWITRRYGFTASFFRFYTASLQVAFVRYGISANHSRCDTVLLRTTSASLRLRCGLVLLRYGFHCWSLPLRYGFTAGHSLVAAASLRIIPASIRLHCGSHPR